MLPLSDDRVSTFNVRLNNTNQGTFYFTEFEELTLRLTKMYPFSMISRMVHILLMTLFRAFIPGKWVTFFQFIDYFFIKRVLEQFLSTLSSNNMIFSPECISLLQFVSFAIHTVRKYASKGS